MSNYMNKPKILKSFLAILVVFLMTAGAFIGAAENESGDNVSESIAPILPENPEAGQTITEQEFDQPMDVPPEIPMDEPVEEFKPRRPHTEPESVEGPMPVVPANEPNNLDWLPMGFRVPAGEVVKYADERGNVYYINDKLEVAKKVPYWEVDMEYTESITTTETNSLSTSMKYITDPIEKSASTSAVTPVPSAPPRSRGVTKAQIVLGTDNNDYPGQGMGRIYKSSTQYNCYNYAYMYPYYSSSSYDARGWAVYDFRDLANYQNLNIDSGYILYRQMNLYYTTEVEFWTMDSSPYEITSYSSTGPASVWYKEIGGTGSVLLGINKLPGGYNYGVYLDRTVPISSAGITELNNRTSDEDWDFSMGCKVTKPSNYNYLQAADVRLVLNVTFTEIPGDSGKHAQGDVLSGYVYSYSIYPNGYLMTSTSYRGFTTFNTTQLTKLIPPKGMYGDPVVIEDVVLRFNQDYGYLGGLQVWDMGDVLANETNLANMYSDAGSGIMYTSVSAPVTYISTPREYEISLGTQAAKDLNAAIAAGRHFGLGLARTSNYGYYISSPKLVIYWKVQYPPMKTIQFGSDNPKFDGDAMGYSQKSFVNTYVCNAKYNAKSVSISMLGSTQEDRGWAVFDIENMTQWPGAKAKRAKLIIHNYEIRDAKEINFTVLSTTPSHGSTSAKTIWTESGPTGTQIGTYFNPLFVDSTRRTIEATLNLAAITSMNENLSKTPPNYLFAVGMYIRSSYKQPSSADFRDIRLLVDFEYTSEIQPTGKGLAFGDDWSGYIEKFTDPRNKDFGYMYAHQTATPKMDNRSYVQWEISKIRDLFPAENLSFVKITKLSLIFNHYTGAAKEIYIYDLKDLYANYNKITTTTISMLNNIYTDCGNGSLYYGPSKEASGNNMEYKWDLSSAAATDFQNNLIRGSKYFNIGIITKATAGNTLGYGPKLGVEWEYDFLVPFLTDPTPEGFEGSAVEFNASLSRNNTGGFAGLTYSWDWDNNGIYDYTSSKPTATNTWPDDYYGPITLKITDTAASRSRTGKFTVEVFNVNPVLNITSGKITPQPAKENEDVTFFGFSFSDPGADTWTYFWDFNNDGEYDVGGAAYSNKTIPTETWFYDDNQIGVVSVLVMDDDGGSTNKSIPHEIELNPSATGYAGPYFLTPTMGDIQIKYSTLPDIRGWARFNILKIPQTAKITGAEFNGWVSKDNKVENVAVRQLSTDPRGISTTGTTVFNEAGTGNLLFEMPWYETVMDPISIEFGRKALAEVQSALPNGWLGLGFDIETPKAPSEGTMQGKKAFSPPILKIKYTTDEPAAFIPVEVINVAPEVNCSKLVILPTDKYEGSWLQVSNISFSDVGNDSYELNVRIGEEFETGWMKLGEKPYVVPGSSILVLTMRDSPDTSYEQPFLDWFEEAALANKWNYEIKAWDEDLDFSDYSVVIFAGEGYNSPYSSYSEKLKEEIIDKGISLFVNGNYAYRTMQALSLGQYNYWMYSLSQNIYGNYAGLTTGYTGETEMATQGYGYAYGIYKSTNMNGVALATFSGQTYYDNYCSLAVYDKGVHSYNGATGDMNTGKVKGKVAYAGFRYYGYTSMPLQLTDDYDIIMSRIINWLLVGAANAEDKVVPGWGVWGAGEHLYTEWFQVYMVDDDPTSGTSQDNVNITIQVRDDDDHILYPGTGLAGLEEPGIIATGIYSQPGNSQRKLTVDDEYNLYSIWSGYGKGDNYYQIYCSKSEDGGQTWEQFKVSWPPYFNYYQYYPSLAIDSKGKLHCTWYGYLTTSTVYNIRYASSTDGGETWGEFTNLTSDPSGGYNFYPSVAVDVEDTVHIIWAGRSTSISTPYNVRYINRSATGMWSPMTQLTNSPYPYDHGSPAITFDTMNNIHLVWEVEWNASLPSYNIVHMMKWAANDTWSPMTLVTKESNINMNPTVVLDTKNNIHIAWQSAGGPTSLNYNIHYRMYDNSTSTWKPIEYITTYGMIGYYTPYQQMPSLAVNSKDELDVVWFGYQPPDIGYPYAIHHASKVSGKWKLDENFIVDTSYYQYYPNAFYSPPQVTVNAGYAFMWHTSNGNQLKYYTSPDFELGNPRFTDGLAECTVVVFIQNVAPEFDENATFTRPSVVEEQNEFSIHAEFTDPAAGYSTESFLYNVTWGTGDYSGWQPVEQFIPGRIPGLTEITLQPGPEDGIDTYVYDYYPNYNFGRSMYLYTYSYYYYTYKTLIKWDLRSVPKDAKLANATMRVNYAYKYGSDTLHFYPITEDWEEGTKDWSTGTGNEVTWNNMPDYDDTNPVSTIRFSEGQGWVNFPLNTSMVMDWIKNPTTNYGMISEFENEGSADAYGYFWSSDYYTPSDRPKLILEFEDPLPPVLPRGIIDESYFFEDDHPDTGTPWDIFDITIDVKDDDLGTDYMETNITVHNVVPDVLEGVVTPTTLDQGIIEGTEVSLEYFRFNDVAYKVPTEYDYGFNWSVDWGDGTPVVWSDKFRYTSNAGETYIVHEDGYYSSTAMNSGRRLLATKDGDDYIFYSVFSAYEGNYPQIVLGISRDIGETWENHLVSSAGQFRNRYQYYPTLAMDSQGILHVAWQGTTPTNAYPSVWYANSTDGGKTWGNFAEIASGFYERIIGVHYFYRYQYSPVITMDSNDVAHIAWEYYYYKYNYTSSANRYTRENAIRYVNNDGGSWSTPFDIIFNRTSGSSSAYRPQNEPSIAVDSSDNIHVAWWGALTTSYDYNIQYRKRSGSTGLWDPIVNVTNNRVDDQYRACIMVDGDDNVHIVWDAYPYPYQIKHIKWDSTTSTWGSVEAVSDNDNYNYYASIGYDQRGYLYVAWYSSGTMGTILAYSVNDGTGWSEQMTLTKDLYKLGLQYPQYPVIMYGTEDSIAPSGVCLIFSAQQSDFFEQKVLWTSTFDYYLGDYGPKRGIEKLTHFYADDNPSGTDGDEYNMTLRVRDDDTGIGEYQVSFMIENIWPEVESGLAAELVAAENAMYTPTITFTDPGTGPTETWEYWFDLDGSETLTSLDLTGSVTDTEVIGGMTHGTIPSIRTPFNDDYDGTIGVYVYDDDAPATSKYINITNPIVGTGTITNVTWPANYNAMAMSNGRKLAIDSKGNLYTVYPSYQSPYEIRLGVSYDVGATEPWVEKNVTNINTVGTYYYQYYPSLAIDLNDVIHVVWSAQTSTHTYYTIYYTKSTDGGDTWTTPVNLSAPGVYDYNYPSYINYRYNYYPALAVDSNNVVHVTWDYYEYYYDYTVYNYWYDNVVYYVNNSGGSWGTPFRVDYLNSTYSGYYTPSIATDKFDNVHIVWSNTTLIGGTYTYNLHYRKLDAKTGWQPKVPITKETNGYYYSSYYTCITSDLLGNLHVTWEQSHYVWWQYGRNIRYIMWNASTSTWGNAENLTDSMRYHYSPTIGVNQAGTIYVAWYGYAQTGYQYDIYASMKVLGGSFTDPLALTTDDYFFDYQYYPNLLGYGPNAYPEEGMAGVWRGYAEGGNHVFFYATEEFDVGKVYERLGFKHKWDAKTMNTPPQVVMPPSLGFLPGEHQKLMIQLTDQGSDDIYAIIDWGDGTTPDSEVFYNDGVSPEPVYLPTHSATYGTAAFTVDPEFSHTYANTGDFTVNITLWDDDMRAQGLPGVSTLLDITVLKAKAIKEMAIELLESILPGRTGILGYNTMELKYHGPADMTVLIYNHISRPPFYWETTLLMSVCNVQPGDTIFINGTYLTNETMFGTKLILKIYNESCGVIDVTEISTVYTCLESLKIGQRYGKYEILGFTTLEGMIYHHYSKFALKTEDALDHILRSINRDPRRGYGWWHQYWAWWNGYTIYRGLWVDDTRLDPQFGLVVFCEERAAVLDLMEVVKNCLDPVGVINITFVYQGGCGEVDVEAYILSDFWWGGWKWFDGYYDLPPGQPFTVEGSTLSGGVLTDRIMLRVYNANTGALLDTIYVRSSGEWFLEVEPGNIYGDFVIIGSTLLLEDSTEWDDWWGGDTSWWDYFFGFWYWENEKFRSGCGWEPEECFDVNASLEEEARICSNLTILKFVINMLAKADDMIARQAWQDAENVTVSNVTNNDEYMYHLKWARRYWHRGYDNYHKGRPHRAISDFKMAWKYSVIAIKWALKLAEDPEPSGDDMDDPCAESGCQKECVKEYEEQVPTPWWMYWYYSWTNCKSLCGYLTTHCGCWQQCACWNFGMQDDC